MISASFPAQYSPPRLPIGVIQRRRLLNLLHNHIDEKVIVVTAGAGYGKTTLLTHFAQEVDFSICWLSLDRWHTDPVTFVEHLVGAIQKSFPEFGQSTLVKLRAVRQFDDHADTLATAFLRDLEESVPDYLAVVLDDYHEVDGNASISNFLDLVLPRCRSTFT